MSSMPSPQILVRPASERGHFNFGWLDTWHSFSFGDYRDPEWMGFRALRVINDDYIAAGAGFPMHPHRDMEIITYVLDGEVSHKDSMGNSGTIREGEVQYMCAGTGIMHSEANSSAGKTRILQIWIRPQQAGLPPGYGQAFVPAEEKLNQLRLVAGPDGSEALIPVHQDARLYASVLEAGKSLAHGLPAGRYAWLQVARGSLTLNGITLNEGDGAAISPAGESATELSIESSSGAEFILFDLA